MRFTKPLAVAGVLSVTLLGGTMLTGAAFADAGHPKPHPAAAAPAARHDVKDGDHSAHPRRTEPATASVEASVSPDTIGQGGSYTVSIATTNVSDGTDAVVTGPDGQTSTVTVEGGAASATLALTGHIKPGTYTVSVEVAGVSTTATLNVTR